MRGAAAISKLQTKYVCFSDHIGLFVLSPIIPLVITIGVTFFRDRVCESVSTFLFTAAVMVATLLVAALIGHATLSFIFICLGEMTLSEGIRYLLFLGYPNHWCRRKYRISNEAKNSDWQAFLLKGLLDLHKILPQYYMKTKNNTAAIFVVHSMATCVIALLLIQMLNLVDIHLPDKQLELLTGLLLLVTWPLVWYASMVLTLGTLGTIMICQHKITFKEFLRYSFFSHYPNHWFRNRFRIPETS